VPLSGGASQYTYRPLYGVPPSPRARRTLLKPSQNVCKQ